MYKKVDVGKKILSANEEYALKNSRLLAEHKIFCLNMISVSYTHLTLPTSDLV